MTKITPVRPDMEYTSSNTRQLDADSQRNAWLRQLEMDQLGLFQAEGQLRQAPGEEQGKHAPSNDAGNTSQRANPLSTRAPRMTTPVVPVHPAVAQTQQVAASGEQAQATPIASAAAASATTPALAAQGTAALAQVTHAPRPANTVQTASSIAGQQAAPLQPPAGAASFAATTAPGAVDVAIEANTADEAVVSTKATDPLRPAPSITLSANAQDADAAEEIAEEPAETPHRAADSADRTTAGEDWQKRQMHIAQNGRDVSLSVRDGALDARQASQLVYKLASDMVDNGLRLYRATINGRTIVKAPRPMHTADGRQSSANSPVATPFNPLSVEEPQHGA